MLRTLLFVDGAQNFPRQTGLHAEHILHRTALRKRRRKRWRAKPEHSSLQRHGLAIGLKSSVNHGVGIGLRCDLHDGGMRKSSGIRQAHALQRRQPVFPGKHIHSAVFQALRGYLGESFAEPVEIGHSAVVFKWKNQKCFGAGLDGSGARIARGLSGSNAASRRGSEKYRAGDEKRESKHTRGHSNRIVTEHARLASSSCLPRGMESLRAGRCLGCLLLHGNSTHHHGLHGWVIDDVLKIWIRRGFTHVLIAFIE